MILRGATPEDAAFLFSLRTDPATVAVSRGHVPDADAHAVWLHDTLVDAERRLWIAEDDGEAVGVVRLDRVAALAAVVSITVAPAHRRKRYGVAMLGLVDAAAPIWGVTRLIAEIMDGNTASQGLFERAGYAQTAPGLWERVRC